MELILQYIPAEVWGWIGMGVIALSALGMILKSVRQILVACKKLAEMTKSKTDDTAIERMIGWVDELAKWADDFSDFLGDLLRARPRTIGKLLKAIPNINRWSRG